MTRARPTRRAACCTARAVIPYRGSWLRLRVRPQGTSSTSASIGRRKLHATVLLRALGYSTEELLNYFYDTETIHFEPNKKYQPAGQLRAADRTARDARHPQPRRTKDTLVKKNRKVHQAGDPQAAGRGLSTSCRSISTSWSARSRPRDVISTTRPARLLLQWQRGADRGQARRAPRARRRARRWSCSSTTSTSARTCATRC